MRRQSVAVSLACTAALTALASFSLPATARAQSADLVLCDRVAAEPTDPDKPRDVVGVASISPSDIPLAIRYCRVASGSSRRALFELGRAYAANKQLPDALAAYRKAVDKGSTAAMVELGLMFSNGIGVARDEAQARKLLERAADAGNPRAVTSLATRSGGGSGGAAPSDAARTRAMLTRAAETNSAEAEYQLGLMTAEGIGGPKDDVAARALFEKAAEQNHAGALERLGSFAMSGRGGAQDSSVAKTYYERAAALGNEDAKAALQNINCSWVIKDKSGKIVTHLCF